MNKNIFVEMTESRASEIYNSLQKVSNAQPVLDTKENFIVISYMLFSYLKIEISLIQ